MSNWNPDTGAPLTAEPIKVTAVEETSFKLWHEFLTGWFDGGSHMLRGAYVTIPKVDTLSFQEAPIEPADGLYLQVTMERPGAVQKRLRPDGAWWVTERAKVNFWFRAKVKTARSDGHNSRSLVRWGSDTLTAILDSNLLVAALNAKGMTAFCPQPTILVGGVIMAMRLLSLGVTYTYPLEELVTAQPSVGTYPALQASVPGRVVYIGQSKTVRVTDNGLERLGSDGQWYLIDIALLEGESGVIPSVGSQAAPTS
jgi:hypothetical protein